jgi:glycine cleavage system H protein
VTKNWIFIFMNETDLKFSKEHEWIRLTTDGQKDIVVTVGISQFAQEQLNDIVSVELPQKGIKAKKMQAIAIIDSVKASSDIYSPLSGEIIEANDQLLEHPELINQSPYDLGWIIKLRPDNLSGEIGDLMSKQQYEEFIKTR